MDWKLFARAFWNTVGFFILFIAFLIAICIAMFSLIVWAGPAVFISVVMGGCALWLIWDVSYDEYKELLKEKKRDQ